MRTSVRFYTLLKWCFMVSLVTATTVILISPDIRQSNIGFRDVLITVRRPLNSPSKNWRNLSSKQISNLSALGKYLFTEDALSKIEDSQKIYKILTWKFGQFLEKRHIYHFTNLRHDPFEKCSVRNCEITYDEKELPNADAVLIHMQRLIGSENLPKENGIRPKNQRWVFLTDETPLFTFLNSKVNISSFNGKFNWSMNYRMEADVPVPYGRTIIKKYSLDNLKTLQDIESITSDLLNKRNDVLVAVMGSNCGSKNHRWKYVKELQKYIKVDFYGKCGTLKCPGHFSKDCPAIGDYKFYLSFENSNCAQYVTEKLWWNAYSKNSIPIVMGASKKDYEQLLPPNSYINTEDFARPIDLARYILYANKTRDVYMSYFEWKTYFEVLNEHGYFQSNSFHYCRLCEALNYNSKDVKIYNNLENYWSKKDCYPGWDEITND